MGALATRGGVRGGNGRVLSIFLFEANDVFFVLRFAAFVTKTRVVGKWAPQLQCIAAITSVACAIKGATGWGNKSKRQPRAKLPFVTESAAEKRCALAAARRCRRNFRTCSKSHCVS